ncbi:glutathione S-transferase family protein [Arvimicrobium flavum]|uniref:glutathione S-transferase family protein n=1 Tax=Arvimicrobium flavum TaxID=3393320 RepID=UPI00237BB8F5|nr:glutathione S-transferase family protein [Mesorhizobium shangrilense]
MILIGQYDSSYVRRVGIALALYEIPFEHRPWSTFGDAERLAEYNPLLRVLTLVLDSGDVLVESHVILDYVDGLVPAGRRMYPQTEPERHRALGIAALATGLADKAVSLFYERVLHKEGVSPLWVERCTTQIANTLGVLEESRKSASTSYWFGERIGHADIAVTVALRHLGDSHPDLAPLIAKHTALAAHAARLEALPVFQKLSQPFLPPA